jgi:hypothetical protein
MTAIIRRRHRGRWLLAMASVTTLLVGTLILAVDGSAGASVDPGQGSSSAQSFYVLPHEGSLAVGVILGEALAGHTNNFARAQSQGTDLGAVGLTLTSGQTCGKPAALTPDQIPQPFQAETGQAGASQGLKQDPTTLAAKSGNPPPSFGSTEFVKATDTPYGEADTSYTAVDGGVFSVSGLASKAWSGVVDGKRVAASTSDIGSLRLLGGVVTLDGLHWETTFPSGGAGSPTGTFSIGRVLVNGTSVPTGPGLEAVQKAINSVLGTLGIQLVLPVPSLDQGVESVSPLQIRAEPNKARDDLIRAINDPTRSTQQTIIDGLEGGFKGEPSSVAQAHCPSVVPITVAHITIASIDGGGFFSAGFGGVNASSSEIPPNAFSLGTLGLGNLNVAGSSQFVPGTPGTPGTAGVAGSPALAGQPGSASAPSLAGAPGSSQSRATGIRAAASTGTSAGGPLLGVGLGGLGLLALLAEGDRRKMRHALRSVTFEE